MNEQNKTCKKLSNKELKDMYRDSKDSNLVNLYTNGIHQMLNVQLLYLDNIEDILKKWGLNVQTTKQTLNSCKKIFNTLEKFLQQNIGTEIQQQVFNKEFDDLYNALSRYFLVDNKEKEETGETQYEEDKD